MATNLFVLGDGDKIRQTVERHLFTGNLERLRDFSSGIASAIEEIEKFAIEDYKAEIIVAGGDEVLLKLPARHIKTGALERFAVIFKKGTGSTMSFGYAPSVDAAYINLRRAKAQGGGVVVGTD